MCIPWYGLASVLQNHTWAHAQHDLIGRLRDRLDRGVPWLTREQAKLVSQPRLLETAQHITRAMVWPPLAYTMNDDGQLNRAALQEVCAPTPAHDRAQVLLELSRSQDRAISLLASWAMVRFEVMPTDGARAPFSGPCAASVSVRCRPLWREL